MSLFLECILHEKCDNIHKNIISIYIFCLLEVRVRCDLSQVNGQSYIKTKVNIRSGMKFYPQKIVFVILITLLVSEFTIQSAVPSGHEDSETSNF